MHLKYIRIKGKLIQKGDIIPMYIKKVIDNGVFAQVDMIESFIPIQKLRYGFITNIYSEYEIGKQIFVKVNEIISNEDGYLFEVSGKDAQIDPWSELGVINTIHKGKMVSGKVTAVHDYGLFVNIFDGVDALVRPLSKRAYNYQPVHVGDNVDIKISDINYKERKIYGRLRHIEKRVRIHY